jgi:hypothetical protein
LLHGLDGLLGLVFSPEALRLQQPSLREKDKLSVVQRMYFIVRLG